ncbi:hypothetical protein [Pedobacter sp. R20-19]|uniref:hypothetical protein n=1 Tax=Pedobacter sp. R20-19 TaxID=1270196 RepID=UPI000493A8F5|nr:hypothetical protein [Pedobacter sp. R20-19]
MERLENINIELANDITKVNVNQLNKIMILTCNYSYHAAHLEYHVFMSQVIEKIEINSTFEIPDMLKILDIAQEFDEKYYDLDERGNTQEALLYFSKARASMAIYYAVKFILNQDRLDLQESIYEASMVNEEPIELFEILKKTYKYFN